MGYWIILVPLYMEWSTGHVYRACRLVKRELRFSDGSIQLHAGAWPSLLNHSSSNGLRAAHPAWVWFVKTLNWTWVKLLTSRTQTVCRAQTFLKADDKMHRILLYEKTSLWGFSSAYFPVPCYSHEALPVAWPLLKRLVHIWMQKCCDKVYNFILLNAWHTIPFEFHSTM
jgi:hypothetical protein